MSLRGFHLVFIGVCLLLFGFLLAWGLVLTEEKDAVSAVMVVAGALGLLGLPLYGHYFLKKAKSINL